MMNSADRDTIPFTYDEYGNLVIVYHAVRQRSTRDTAEILCMTPAAMRM